MTEKHSKTDYGNGFSSDSYIKVIKVLLKKPNINKIKVPARNYSFPLTLILFSV